MKMTHYQKTLRASARYWGRAAQQGIRAAIHWQRKADARARLEAKADVDSGWSRTATGLATTAQANAVESAGRAARAAGQSLRAIEKGL